MRAFLHHRHFAIKFLPFWFQRSGFAQLWTCSSSFKSSRVLSCLAVSSVGQLSTVDWPKLDLSENKSCSNLFFFFPIPSTMGRKGHLCREILHAQSCVGCSKYNPSTQNPAKEVMRTVSLDGSDTGSQWCAQVFCWHKAMVTHEKLTTVLDDHAMTAEKIE